MSDKYAFIAGEYARNPADESADAPTLIQMLAWLGVSKSGFYEWRDREPSAAAIRREQLKEKIAALFKEYEGTYGYRRIQVELLRDGEQVGEELVRALMRELGLVTVQPRPYRKTTVRGDDETDVPDLVSRNFTAERPGMKLVGDITYIPTWQGWLYLATWRASQIPDTGPNKVRPGTEDDQCENGAESSRLSSRTRPRRW